MKILIKNALLQGKNTDLFVEGSEIKKIGENLNLKADEKIDGRGQKALLPGLVNCHTHAAMSLLRGFADDLPLKEWLQNKIWPVEAKLSEDDIFWGTKLACLEMIKSGTTAFNDMYFFPAASIQAAKEMGLRAVIGLVVFDNSPNARPEAIEKNYRLLKPGLPDFITLAVAPHAIYTVSRQNLVWSKNFARREKLILHIHVSETSGEVAKSLKEYRQRPVEYLSSIGLLGENVVLAHSVYLSDREIGILSQSGGWPVNNPSSNLKLASGEIFPYRKYREKNIKITLGTDGAASNNSLDMFREMKTAALLQKNSAKNPVVFPAGEVLESATVNGARALKINAGKIEAGRLADFSLIDLNKIYFFPGYNFRSDLVYSASGDCVSDLVCNGKILMRDGKIEGEGEILKEIKKRAERIKKIRL